MIFFFFLVCVCVVVCMFVRRCNAAQLSIGNVLPVGSIPEGTAICNVELHTGDRCRLARASGNYCIVVSHNPDENLTRIRLPSGMRKILKSDCRAMVGAVAGGGRPEKPILKAGRAYFKYRAKRRRWPIVRHTIIVFSNAFEHCVCC